MKRYGYNILVAKKDMVFEKRTPTEKTLCRCDNAETNSCGDVYIPIRVVHILAFWKFTMSHPLVWFCTMKKKNSQIFSSFSQC